MLREGTWRLVRTKMFHFQVSFSFLRLIGIDGCCLLRSTLIYFCFSRFVLFVAIGSVFSWCLSGFNVRDRRSELHSLSERKSDKIRRKKKIKQKVKKKKLKAKEKYLQKIPLKIFVEIDIRTGLSVGFFILREKSNIFHRKRNFNLFMKRIYRIFSYWITKNCKLDSSAVSSFIGLCWAGK